MGAIGLLTKLGSKIYSKTPKNLQEASAALTKNPLKRAAIGYGVVATAVIVEDIIGDIAKLPQNMAGTFNLKFPLDDSAGNFQTELTFYSWKNTNAGIQTIDLPKGVNTQQEGAQTNYLGHLFLPMPLQLGTAYSGKFSEGDDMVNDRQSVGGMGSGFIDLLASNLGGGVVELKKFANTATHLNNSSQMAGQSVNNNHMGMIYEGTNLRGHTFSWRLSAKNEAEQNAIEKIIKTIKFLSLSEVGFGGTEDVQHFINRLKSGEDGKDLGSVEDVFKGGFSGGRLTIPPTASVRFLDNGNVNEHLFKIKDSFITNVEVNYTSQGTWQAHKDGAPTEIQLSITLKEVTAVTRADIRSGY
jgi:hypothetical protein